MRARTWVDRTRPLWRLGNRWEAMLLRRFGASGMSILRRSPLLVLETTGRRTGRARAAPVAFWTEGDDYFIGGGAAGMTKVDWVANLRADADAAVVVRRRRVSVHATELTADEYERARSHALTLWPSVTKYERMSGRRVPYFRLTERRQHENVSPTESVEPEFQEGEISTTLPVPDDWVIVSDGDGSDGGVLAGFPH